MLNTKLNIVQGLAISTNSQATITAINAYTEQCLSYGNRAEACILEAIAADPECVLANTFAAAYYLSQENSNDAKTANVYLVQARKNFINTNERERLHLLATEAWAERKIDQAILHCEEIVTRYPQDLLAVQQAQYHYFYTGNKLGLTSVAGSVLDANVGNHYLMGMLAFGLEQSNHLAQAERLARFALEINRADPWAQHAVIHAMETQERYLEGITWMESFADTWESCNSMLYTHNWWHVALSYLAIGEIRHVLSLFDRHIWGKATKRSPKDQVGAISLLLRLELIGIDVGDRLEQVSHYLFERIHEHSLPFQDLHYIYALARTNQMDLAREMLFSMESYAHDAQPCHQKIWQQVALPAARGAIAHAICDYKKARKEFKPILTRLQELGGSNTQRQLFEQIFDDAHREVIINNHHRRNYEAIAS
jgi:tetratricopeptide (TPR) repeat protein